MITITDDGGRFLTVSGLQRWQIVHLRRAGIPTRTNPGAASNCTVPASHFEVLRSMVADWNSEQDRETKLQMLVNDGEVVFIGNTYPHRDWLKSMNGFYRKRGGQLRWTLHIDKLEEARAYLRKVGGIDLDSEGDTQ